ncbi:MAG: energy-coupling factor transporter transmembrane protein EcfT [Clostridia bacterium]|nr:energy-coupling factor transporter transmembrane protein EcfT [Clostridia bacterium]
MMKEFSFGSYYPENSFVHKMDARVKILLSIAYIVAVFLVKNNTWINYLGFVPCLLFVIIVAVVSKIPFIKVVKSIKTIIFFVILSALLQIFFNKSGTPLWKNGFITDKGLYNAGYIFLRIVLVVMGASLLTFTTSPVEIADGIESLLTPLKLIKFPVHEFALVMSIALRFIPTLLDETDRIIKAQTSRGADFNSGNIFKKAKALIPILIPLLISSFRRADELADAMDARCYAGSKNRTKYKKMKLSLRDLIGTLFTALLIVGVCFL